MAPAPLSEPSERGLARCPIDQRDIESWPQVDVQRIESAEASKRYERLCNATQLYLKGQPLKDVLAAARVGNRRFFRLFERACDIHPDGRIVGCRAFVKGARIRAPQRTAPRATTSESRAGYAGMFGQLLREHPRIELLLSEALCRKGEFKLQMNKLGFRTIHRLFLQICEQVGVPKHEYPYSTRSKAKPALRRWLREVFMGRHASRWLEKQAGADARAVADYASGSGDAARPQGPYRVWQLDEYTIDLLARFELPSPFGDWEDLELPRFPVIRLIEVDSGANLAGAPVLASQVSVNDLIELLWQAMSGPREVPPVVEGLKPIDGAGYPAKLIPETRFAVPSIIYLDNSLAHLADALQRLVTVLWGGAVRLGPPATPLERAAIESRIGQAAKRVVQQLPASTGSHPRDPVRQTARCAVSQRVRFDELEHVLDVYFQNENALPTAASRYVSALERLRRQAASGGLDPMRLSAHKRKPHYFFPATTVTVRAALKQGRTPFVNYLGQRYSSEALRRAYGLVNTQMIVRADPRDLRTLLLFKSDGHEFGPIQVLGRWGQFPQDVRIRRMFLRLKREAADGEHPEDMPLQFMFRHLRAKAPRNRMAALQLTYLVNYLSGHINGLDEATTHQYRELQSASAAVKTSAVVPLLPAPCQTEGQALPSDSAAAPAPSRAAPVEHIPNLALHHVPHRRVCR